MRSIFLGSLQIHDNQNSGIGYFVEIPIEGLEYPPVRQSIYDKPGEHGSNLSNVLYSGRTIIIVGSVFASTNTTYEALRRALEGALRIVKNQFTVPVPLTLYFTTTDSLALQTDTFIKSFELKVTNVTNGKFRIELFAPDFPLYSQSQSVATLTRASGGGAVYPIIYPIIYGASTGGQALVVNQGDAESYPVITLNGPITNPIIQNVTTGRYLELDMTLNSGDQVVIDMKNKTIVLNGTQSVIGNKNSASQWWWLDPGNNTIRFFTSSGADTGNVQIAYRDAYIGA